MSTFEIDLLPTEVLVEIFQRLAVKEILAMRRVSTRLKRVAREKEIWKGVVIYDHDLTTTRTTMDVSMKMTKMTKMTAMPENQREKSWRTSRL